MALLFFKVYPKSESGHLIDGTESGIQSCYVEDDFLSEIYDIIGENKVVVYDDELGTNESQFPCISGDAIQQVKIKAKLHIDQLIITAANLINDGKDRAKYYSKIMYIAELLRIIDLKIEFNLNNDLAILQLEP